ncbi:MAG TPA: hypothetical protein PJ991_12705 [Kiritimatiellia bacterium]|nr:hypothetical protein [Kiritimatiellia bacterium]HMP91056.1 hypothetical protein [Kiritimatiellia bacterium]
MGRYGIEELLDAAGQLCLAIMLSNAGGLSLSQPAANARRPSIQDLFGHERRYLAAAKRRLFIIDENEHVFPSHRTIAEYLGARTLSQKLLNGELSLIRVITLLTGPTGETTSDLRGLYGWLPCFCPEQADALIPIDPLGIVLHGDPSMLSVSLKQKLLYSLKELAKGDPWFRAGNWSGEPFGALCKTEMAPTFRRFIDDEKTDDHVVSCILDAIRYGEPVPSLGNALLRLIRKGGANGRQAVEAFVRACPGRITDLKPVLDDIVKGVVDDPDRFLRPTLLRQLYPAHIPIEKIIDYFDLENVDSDPINSYTLQMRLLEESSTEDAVRLLETIIDWKDREKLIHNHCGERIVSKLLWRVVQSKGDTTPIPQIYKWLGVGVENHGHNFIRDKETKLIRAWLSDRPVLYEKLFHHWLGLPHDDGLDGLPFSLFTGRMLNVPRPAGYWRKLLIKAIEPGIDSSVSRFLFCVAVHDAFNSTASDGLALDDVLLFVKQNPSFHDLYENLHKVEINDLRTSIFLKRQQHKQNEKSRNDQFIHDLTSRIPGIIGGQDLSALSDFASVYFHSRVEGSDKLTPWERISFETNQELADAAFEGIKRMACRDAPFSALQVGRAKAKNKEYRIARVVLAGLDIIARERLDLKEVIPDAMVELAVAFHLSEGGYDEDKLWLGQFVHDRPSVVSKAMLEYFRPVMRVKREAGTPGLYELAGDSPLAKLASTVAPALLKQFPAAQEPNLRTLMKAVLRACPREEILALARAVLSKPGKVEGEARLMWETLCWITCGENDKGPSFSLRPTAQNAILVMKTFLIPLRNDSGIAIKPSMDAVLAVISYCGRACRPEERFRSGFVREIDETSRYLGELIGIAGGSADVGVADKLWQMIRDPKLKPWHKSLLHARAVCLRKIGERYFNPPSASSIVKALSGGPPVDICDLKSVALDALEDIQRDITHGRSNGYEAFWNVGRHGKPIKNAPLPENTCRNRLMEFLRSRLVAKGIRVEREGSRSNDRRTDLSISCGAFSLPIEIKLQSHRALWTAVKTQLVDSCAKDPDALNRGIYIVIYHGKYGKKVKPPPKGVTISDHKDSLRDALLAMIPDNSKPYISVFVLDVSYPFGQIRPKGSSRMTKPRIPGKSGALCRR